MKQQSIASIELMERAATALADLIERRLGGCEGHVVAFACGAGGNAGDGYAAARLFALRGGRSEVFPALDESRLSGDALTNCRLARETPRCFVREMHELDALPRPELWVDALFGIGLSRPIAGESLRLARRIARDRAEGAVVLSVDVPSGLDALSGRPLGEAVTADITLTFEHPKLGHLLLDGPELCGELITASIGIPESMLDGEQALLVGRDDLRPFIKPRRRNTHKGDYGHLLLIAGSRGMAGAAVIAAGAALRSGVGLLTIACPESIMPILQVKAPCAVCAPLPEADGAIAPEAAPIVRDLIRGKRAIAIGPGLTTRASPCVVRQALECGLPAVIDADALNLVAREPELKRLLGSCHLITPHPGEARRLLGHEIASPYDAAMELSALGCRALLKGATTLIAGRHVYLSMAGAPGMAKGGSGDALTGLLGALLAQSIDPETAGYVGAQLHGMAGECAEAAAGPYSMTAEDLIAQLKEAFRLVWQA